MEVEPRREQPLDLDQALTLVKDNTFMSQLKRPLTVVR